MGIITYRVHSYKGIGHIPANLPYHSDPQKRILLDRSPQLLQGYGRSLSSEEAAVLVVLDSDRRDCNAAIKGHQVILSIEENYISARVKFRYGREKNKSPLPISFEHAHPSGDSSVEGQFHGYNTTSC